VTANRNCFALAGSLLAIGLSLALVATFEQALAAKGGIGGGNSGNNGGAKGGTGDNDRHESADTGKSDAQGDSAAVLGRLNASHASAEALANAAPGSVVGEIAAYKTAIEAYLTGQSSLQSLLATDPSCTKAACAAAEAAQKQDLLSAEAALSAAANKPVTTQVVGAVDSNLGLTVDPATESEIATAIAK
jgi:hypothetical protein